MQFKTCLGVIASFTAATQASATVTVTIRESGNDVVESAMGSLDVSSFTNQIGLIGTQSYINSGIANLIMGPDSYNSNNTDDWANYYFAPYYSEIVGPASFGTSLTSFIPTSRSGDAFGTVRILGPGLDYRILIAPHGYVSGTQIASQAVFANRTFAAMGLTPGTYTYSWPSDSIRIEIGNLNAAVPEPASWAMMLVGFGFAGAMLRRRRRIAAST